MLRKIEKNIYPYMTRVLKRDGIKFSVKEQPNYYEVESDITSRRFNALIEDAKCEKQRENSSCPDIPVVSYKTAINPEKVARILSEFHTDCFVLLKSDETKFARMIA
ncbi:MAG: hypothetical protein ACI4HI_18530 [Lachnospiraceae bacterium]